MLGYELLLFLIKIETSTENRNKLHAITPCHSSISFGDHLFSTSEIIFGSGSFAIQVGDHFRSGDHFGSWAQFLEGHEKFSQPESHSKISNLFYLLRVSNLMITGLFYSHSSRKQRSSITSYKKFQTCTALCFYTQIN